MNREAGRCWLCGTSPVELARAEALAARISVNLQHRASETAMQAEVAEDDVTDEVNACPECGAPVLSHSAIVQLRERLNKLIEDADLLR